jgi:hypothetical protein
MNSGAPWGVSSSYSTSGNRRITIITSRGSYNDFLDKRIAAKKEATEPRVPSGKVGSHHFKSFTVATMTILNVTEYLCHK